MTIMEKIIRVREITEELNTIRMTLDGVRYLAGTVNMETTNRCLMIGEILGDRVDLLYKEFQQLDREIKEFVRENGV